ncbi:hypothetical protein BKA62DRAFT_680285 [Auriculariales sp. MPI-PUGE-AT-0066]|nr:hypothetical protein BKA62DRAFT_680285 [Auriculariales sp. MPI-PUGE-AT-0066]
MPHWSFRTKEWLFVQIGTSQTLRAPPGMLKETHGSWMSQHHIRGIVLAARNLSYQFNPMAVFLAPLSGVIPVWRSDHFRLFRPPYIQLPRAHDQDTTHTT